MPCERTLLLLVALGVAACSDGTPAENGGDEEVVQQVSVGFSHTCALAESGAGYCWGGYPGSLGREDSLPTRFGGDRLFRQLSSGNGIFGDYVCGLTTTSTVCRGTMLVGGDMGLLISESPAGLAADVPLDTLAAASTHFCGLATDGAAWCWGDFENGVRGSNQFAGDGWDLVPNAVTGGLAFSSIGAGVAHTCGLTADGAVWCWGSAAYLGAPSAVLDSTDAACALGFGPCASAPVRTELTAPATRLFVGPVASCATTAEAQLWCWGTLPTGGGETVAASRQLAIPGPVASVALGSEHGCALTTAGQAYCFGVNTRGQLGTGELGAPSGPVASAGALRFTALSAGNGATCGLTADHALYCWGDNELGLLGTGDREHRATPVRVSLPAS